MVNDYASRQVRAQYLLVEIRRYYWRRWARREEICGSSMDPRTTCKNVHFKNGVRYENHARTQLKINEGNG